MTSVSDASASPAFDVFISHSSEDKIVADAICAILEQQRLRCWIAPRDIQPGKEWGEAIIDGIEQSSLMVVVFSCASNNSTYVLREIERAVSGGLTVVPVRIEDVLPSKKLKLFLSATHWLDAISPPVENHFHHLAATLTRILGREPAQPVVHDQPAEPDVNAGRADVTLGQTAPAAAALISIGAACHPTETYTVAMPGSVEPAACEPPARRRFSRKTCGIIAYYLVIALITGFISVCGLYVLLTKKESMTEGELYFLANISAKTVFLCLTAFRKKWGFVALMATIVADFSYIAARGSGSLDTGVSMTILFWFTVIIALPMLGQWKQLK